MPRKDFALVVVFFEFAVAAFGGIDLDLPRTEDESDDVLSKDFNLGVRDSILAVCHSGSQNFVQ